MFRECVAKFSKNKLLGIFAFIFLFVLTRFPYLGADEINPDGVNWHYRSQQFVVGLKNGDFEKTYQHYHPGVTLMWISGIPIEIYKQVMGVNSYNQYNFLTFNLVAKVSVILAQFVLTLIILLLLSKIVGFRIAYLTVSLFSLEPFFVGNSRLYHMDVLFTLFLFISLLFSWLALRRFTWKKGFLAGIFLSLSFLTKSIGIGGLIFVLVFSTTYYFHKKDAKTLSKYTISVLGSFVLATFLFFPALWVRPFFYLSEIFSESERVGVRKGHAQILLGEYTENAGFLFYPLVVIMKVTPFILAGVLMYLLKTFKFLPRLIMNTKNKYSSVYLYLLIFYLGYFAVMMFPSKKIDRYMLPLYPFLALTAVYGFVHFYNSLQKAASKRIFASFTILAVSFFYAIPLISLFPYYFTYTSPVFGPPANANLVIAQKPFGIAVPALKDYILEKYGDEPKLGFIDTKPMKAIYPNSKVADIRVSGTSDYDLLILGVNEEIPEKVLRSGTKFRKDSSLYVNGLEYWRIYVKEN